MLERLLPAYRKSAVQQVAGGRHFDLAEGRDIELAVRLLNTETVLLITEQVLPGVHFEG